MKIKKTMRKTCRERGVTWEEKRRMEQDISEQNGPPEFLMKCVNFDPVSTRNLIKSVNAYANFRAA